MGILVLSCPGKTTLMRSAPIKCEVGVQSMVSAKRRGFVGGSSVSNKAKVAFTCVLVVLFYAYTFHTPEKKVMGVTSTKPVVKDDIMFDSLWKYSAKDIEGNDLSLSTFKGSVALVVNTATY